MDGDFLLNYIMSSQQKNDLINLVEQLLEDIFKKATRPTPTTSFEKKALEMIYFEIEKRQIGTNAVEMEKFLHQILTSTKALPELKLSIAVSPTEEILERLKDWAKNNNMGNIVFDIDVKPEIIAGAVIITGEGKYIKYSLSDMLDNYFIAKRQELANLL